MPRRRSIASKDAPVPEPTPEQTAAFWRKYDIQFCLLLRGTDAQGVCRIFAPFILDTDAKRFPRSQIANVINAYAYPLTGTKCTAKDVDNAIQTYWRQTEPPREKKPRTTNFDDHESADHKPDTEFADREAANIEVITQEAVTSEQVSTASSHPVKNERPSPNPALGESEKDEPAPQMPDYTPHIEPAKYPDADPEILRQKERALRLERWEDGYRVLPDPLPKNHPFALELEAEASKENNAAIARTRRGNRLGPAESP